VVISFFFAATREVLFMVVSIPSKTGHTIPIRGGYMAPVYRVVIHPSKDTGGYWAECAINEKCGAFTIGDTIKETQVNMYESVTLMLDGDYPDIADFSLEFSMSADIDDE
jgi:hypothetical protein